MNITIPPAEISVILDTNSWKNEDGRRAMIPIMIIIEMPFPTPLSVIRSPNQRTNILPAARIMVAGSMKSVQFTPEANAWLAWDLRLIR